MLTSPAAIEKIRRKLLEAVPRRAYAPSAPAAGAFPAARNRAVRPRPRGLRAGAVSPGAALDCRRRASRVAQVPAGHRTVFTSPRAAHVRHIFATDSWSCIHTFWSCEIPHSSPRSAPGPANIPLACTSVGGATRPRALQELTATPACVWPEHLSHVNACKLSCDMSVPGRRRPAGGPRLPGPGIRPRIHRRFPPASLGGGGPAHRHGPAGPSRGCRVPGFFCLSACAGGGTC